VDNPVQLQAEQLIILSSLWVAFFVLHSLLASLKLKKKVQSLNPAFLRYYRLMFNLLAIALVLPPVWYMRAYPGVQVWSWGNLTWLSHMVFVLSVLAFFWTLRYYDGKEFLGIRQIREHSDRLEDQEAFYISPMHRYVRHPWYTLALLIIWTRNMSESFMVSATLITLYFFIGSILEERKLLAYHGEQYQLYRKSVSGIIPLPWKYLGKDDADKIMNLSNSDKS
jgi:protein-S-isoprenylcysteine O-methyltransferase Ste14